METDIEALIETLRAGKPAELQGGALAGFLAGALQSREDAEAERAALAAFYACNLAEPPEIPGFAELLGNPFAESREKLRGRLHWIKLMQWDPEDPAGTMEYAASALAKERSAFARDRVFVFLRNWKQRARAFPFLGSVPLASCSAGKDDEAFDLVRTELYRAARYEAQKGAAIADSAHRACAAWLDGTLALCDATDALEAASPLLEDFPLPVSVFDSLADAARISPAARPRFRALAGLYGAWFISKPRPEKPRSWEGVSAALSIAGERDPWSRIVLARLSFICEKESLTSDADGRAAVVDLLAGLLAVPPPAEYAGFACEEGTCSFARTALLDCVVSGWVRDGAALASAMAPVLSSVSPYRVEAAASVLRLLARKDFDISAALPAMIEALESRPADRGIFSSGHEIEEAECRLSRQADSSMAFDAVDTPPAVKETGFMNLDGLTGLLAACQAPSAAHRLALALADALANGGIGAETSLRIRKCLADISPRNSAAAAWLNQPR